MYEHDVLAGHPAGEGLSRASLGPGESDTYLARSWADVGASLPEAWRANASAAVPLLHESHAQEVLKSFNTWAFKREQPSGTRLMLTLISRAIRQSQPVSFALYWGKGPRSALASPDSDCLKFLDNFAKRIAKAHAPGAAINLIFTDTHAQLNGHPPVLVHRYFGEVALAARNRGFDTHLLSALVRASGMATGSSPDQEPLPEPIRSLLIASARKWYRGSGTPEEGAAIYYRMNMVERRAVEWAFPCSIFITFNGSELRALFPEHLPVFYMYSLRRGTCVKPWFLPAEATPALSSSGCSCPRND
jgi:hypothetical protein